MGAKRLFCPSCKSLLVARAESADPLGSLVTARLSGDCVCRSCGHRFQVAPEDLPGPPELQDRRKTVRVPIHMPVNLEWGERSGDGTVTDISKGGCAIQSAHSLALTIGQILRLEFPPPTGSVDQLGTQKFATVKNLRGERAGMKFLTPTDEDQVKLSKTISKTVQYFPPKPG